MHVNNAHTQNIEYFDTLLRNHRGLSCTVRIPHLRRRKSIQSPEGYDVIAPKILFVGDDALVRHALRVTLTSAGCVVVEASTGEEALDKVQAGGAVDMIVLDLDLSGIGGLEACRRIREVVDIPIMVISIRHDRQDKVQASDAGADDYLMKPFEIHDLLSRIHALQQKRSL